jgi:glutamate transport system substrate-binding protein
MRTRHLLLTFVAVIAITAAACGGSKNADKTTTTGTAPKFASGTTMAKLQAAGKMTVGVKFDQPGFGQRNPTTNKPEGFDVEIAKRIAERIFGSGGADKIQYVESVSKNREGYIQSGRVDMVVATYTINAARKTQVDFAGPYFVAGQDIMVKKDNTSIKSVTDLNGKKVCSATGATSVDNLKAKAPSASITLYDTYSKCADALGNGQVDAVSTDNAILLGLVDQSKGAYKLVDARFSDEPYGIGVKKGADAFRTFLNDTLQDLYTNGAWAKAFSDTLGKLGLKTPAPPALDRYASTGTATTVAQSTIPDATTSTTSAGATTSTTVAATTTSTY